jgi:hypothetical protein
MVMDITDITNMPKAYGYIPIPWMIGAIVGWALYSTFTLALEFTISRPLIGGSLSRPAERFPDIFGRLELLKTYPYLLPCSISTIFASIAGLVTYFWLKEVSVMLNTHIQITLSVVTRAFLPGHHFGS